MKNYYIYWQDAKTVLSTGETDLKKAEKFAIENLDNHTKEGLTARRQSDEFHKYLRSGKLENLEIL